MSDHSDRWFHLFGARITRRDALRVGRDLAACLALGSMPASGQDRRLRANPFAFGVASGDPEPTSVVLWTRLEASALEGAGPMPVQWEIASDEAFTRIVRRGSSPAPAELGRSVHAEVDGLSPAHEYFYRFLAGGHASTTGRTRTAPGEADSPALLRFAFASCQNYEHGFFTAYRHLASEEIDFVVHLGDYIYERRFAPDLVVRQHESTEVFTLDDYRARYALYRRDADLQAAHAARPWIVTTDDHEVANNYAGDVSENAAPAAQFLLRRAAAYQAYYEFMPLRRSSMPAGPSMRLYRRLPMGRLAAFHVLDTRQYRSDQACGDGRKARCADAIAPERTMMGADQERWLQEGLRASRTRWNVLANQVLIAQSKQIANDIDVYAMDKWDGYIGARDRLLRFLAEAKPSNPVVITGDIHSNWAADLKTNFDDSASPTVGAEFAGTSITTGGDGADGDAARIQSLNPHIKFFNARRGYVRVSVTPARWTTEYRTLPYVSKPGAPIETRATFVVEHGKPGLA